MNALLDAYLDNDLDPAEEKEFATWLAEDEDALPLLVRECCLHRMIWEEHVVKGAAEMAVTSQPPTSLLRRHWKSALIAALAPLAVILALMMDGNEEIARVDDVLGAVYIVDDEGERRPAARGIGLREGQRLETRGDRSFVSFSYPDRTRIDLLGNSSAQLHPSSKGKRFFLMKGSLDARVAGQPDGKPMTFETGSALALIRGTEFRLAVYGESGSSSDVSQLELHEGEVDFSVKGGESLRLKGGEYGIASMERGVEKRPLIKKLTLNFGSDTLDLPEGTVNWSIEEWDPGIGMGWTGGGVFTDVKGELDRTQPLRTSAIRIRAGRDGPPAWEVELSNGYYEVGVCVGGDGEHAGPHHVIVEGSTLFDRLYTKPGELASKSVEIEVRDGKLSVEVSASGIEGSYRDETTLRYLTIDKRP